MEKVDKLLLTFKDKEHASNIAPVYKLTSYKSDYQLNGKDEITNTDVNAHFEKDRIAHSKNAKKRILLLNIGASLKNALSNKTTPKTRLMGYNCSNKGFMASFREQRTAIDKLTRCKLSSG